MLATKVLLVHEEFQFVKEKNRNPQFFKKKYHKRVERSVELDLVQTRRCQADLRTHVFGCRCRDFFSKKKQRTQRATSRLVWHMSRLHRTSCKHHIKTGAPGIATRSKDATRGHAVSSEKKNMACLEYCLSRWMNQQ